MKLRVTIFLIVVCLYTENVIGGSVFIYNNLHHGHYLQVHCKSGDSNLGYHVRRPGAAYSYSFTDHILGKTLYWCHLWKGKDWEDHVVIVAYESKQLPHRDNWVRWSARENGIYQNVNGEENYHFRYNWDGHV
ncbi:unnamed protein product [Arabidopsis halleri]